MDLPNLNALLAAQAGIARWIKPTAQPALESLGEQLGLQLHIKQENRTPAGAFKVRGGLHYLQQQLARQPGLRGVIAASTGNHGRSIAFAARELGLSSAIVVPHHNNPQKNEAMRALGAELVEQGHDFQAALEYSMELAQQRGWHAVPSFHPDLVCGVASYGLELLQAIPDLDAVFVPVGLGSGFCGLTAARQALGHRAQLIAVVSAHAPAYALSVAAGQLIEAPSNTEIAEGVACRRPNPLALQWIAQHAAALLQVNDEQALEAMAILHRHGGEISEGSGALALAALLAEAPKWRGKRVACVLSGGNVAQSVWNRLQRDYLTI